MYSHILYISQFLHFIASNCVYYNLHNMRFLRMILTVLQMEFLFQLIFLYYWQKSNVNSCSACCACLPAPLLFRSR